MNVCSVYVCLNLSIFVCDFISKTVDLWVCVSVWLCISMSVVVCHSGCGCLCHSVCVCVCVFLFLSECVCLSMCVSVSVRECVCGLLFVSLSVNMYFRDFLGENVRNKRLNKCLNKWIISSFPPPKSEFKSYSYRWSQTTTPYCGNIWIFIKMVDHNANGGFKTIHIERWTK